MSRNIADDATDDSIDFEQHKDELDVATFEQVLEMDDEDEEREFSKGIVFGFFEQAEGTFDKIETAIKEKNLEELSALGHFLKGSSATLGLIKVRNACEEIQHFGHHIDPDTGSSANWSDEECLSKISKVFEQVKKDYTEVSKLLKRFYGDGE